MMTKFILSLWALVNLLNFFVAQCRNNPLDREVSIECVEAQQWGWASQKMIYEKPPPLLCAIPIANCIKPIFQRCRSPPSHYQY